MPEKTKIERFYLFITIFSLVLFIMIVFISNYKCTEPSFSARCIKVLDGSNLIAWHDDRWFNNRLKIKLYGIKCSNRNTDIGKKARSFVISQISGKLIEITLIHKKLLGWSDAIVHYKGLCLNEMLLKNNLAGIDYETCKESICKQWKK
ncbi:nuclease [Candidatus Magnetomorum sp. HK-1]|nr:nuclease [Candidatus Magnetomorum sp. HK-1]